MNCEGWSVGAGVGLTTSREASGADMRFVVSAGVVMSDAAFEPLSLTMSSPFPPLLLLFDGGGGFTVRLDGDNALLARKMTSLHRLQSSSSSCEM